MDVESLRESRRSTERNARSFQNRKDAGDARRASRLRGSKFDANRKKAARTRKGRQEEAVALGVNRSVTVLAALVQTLAMHHAALPIPVRPVLQTPLPVDVKSLPGPDEVAVQTLRVATLTLVASIVAIGIGLAGIVVALVDAANNKHQLNVLLEQANRKPRLLIEATVSKARDLWAARSQLPGICYLVDISLWVTNDKTATAAAHNVVAHVLFPKGVMSFNEWEKKSGVRRGVRVPTYEGYKPVNPISVRDIEIAGVGENGCRESRYRSDYGLTVVVGDRKRVSEHLELVLEENVTPIEWYIQTEEGCFPESGSGQIDLMELARDKVSSG